jgi:hypothetical protein
MLLVTTRQIQYQGIEYTGDYSLVVQSFRGLAQVTDDVLTVNTVTGAVTPAIGDFLVNKGTGVLEIYPPSDFHNQFISEEV